MEEQLKKKVADLEKRDKTLSANEQEVREYYPAAGDVRSTFELCQ